MSYFKSFQKRSRIQKKTGKVLVTNVYFNNEEYKALCGMVQWQENYFKRPYIMMIRERREPKILFHNFYLSIGNEKCSHKCVYFDRKNFDI